MAPLLHPLLLTCGALLVLLMGLGLRLQWRGRFARQGHAKRGRWLHHALFFVVTALVLLMAALRGLTGHTYGPLLLPLALLLLMPLTRPGRGNHWRLALLCAAGYGWAAWQVW